MHEGSRGVPNVFFVSCRLALVNSTESEHKYVNCLVKHAGLLAIWKLDNLQYLPGRSKISK